jgi:hypothetical protein
MRFKGRRASTGKEIQTFPEGNPRLFGRKTKFFERESKLNASLSFAESSLFNRLRGPLPIFSFWSRFLLQTPRRVFTLEV